MSLGLKRFSAGPLFDPEEGMTVVGPPHPSKGNWAGACTVLWDAARQSFYLYYRLRGPRPLRGGRCVIAASADGEKFGSIWEAGKEDFGSASIEKSCLFKTASGPWHLYVSYVDPADGRWRIDRLTAEHPAGFDPQRRTRVFSASNTGTEGVKDPYVFWSGNRGYMLISYAPGKGNLTESERREMHATSDIYNTGLTKSSSALAVSEDGESWQWLGEVFAPRSEGWDRHAARLGSVRSLPPVYVGFYDGGPSHTQNYEEQTGIAVSLDLRRWHRLTPDAPALVSPHANGALRYLDAVDFDDEVFYYYEYARADGAHELRLNRVRK